MAVKLHLGIAACRSDPCSCPDEHASRDAGYPAVNSPVAEKMHIGDILTWRRTFTKEEVRAFGSVSGDEGVHHVQPDAGDRLMVQGLLTATLPTKIGGDLNFIANEMTFQFRRPVYTGDTIECRVTITSLEEVKGVTRVSSTWQCRNQENREVMSGHAVGIIRR